MKQVSKALPLDAFSDYMGDVWDVHTVIMMVSFIALGLGFLFMIILRFAVGGMVWLCVLLYYVGLLLLTWSAFQKSRGKSIYDTSGLVKSATHGSGSAAASSSSAYVVASGEDQDGNFVIVDERQSYFSPMNLEKYSYAETEVEKA